MGTITSLQRFNMSNKSKKLSLRIASLNCNSLVKSNNTQKQSQFIRYLHSLKFNIMTFQETHVSDDMVSFVNTQFQAHHSLWTRHCDIVSFSSSFVFSSDLIPANDRAILTKVTHPCNAFAPFYVLGIYAPSTSGLQRRQFFDHVFDLIHTQSLNFNLDRLVIAGDFNYSYQRPHLSSQTSLQWTSFLEDHFYNALQKDDLHELPTFRRNEHIFSTIDYIFMNKSWCSQITESGLHKLDFSWSDRSLVSHCQHWYIFFWPWSLAWKPLPRSKPHLSTTPSTSSGRHCFQIILWMIGSGIMKSH